MPVSAALAQITLLGQHVAHGPGFHPWQFPLVDCGGDPLNHLSFGTSSQYQLRLLDRAWEVGPRGCRIEADRTTQLGIPKVRIVDRSGPGTFHHANKTVLSLDRSFVTVASQDQDLS